MRVLLLTQLQGKTQLCIYTYIYFEVQQPNHWYKQLIPKNTSKCELLYTNKYEYIRPNSFFLFCVRMCTILLHWIEMNRNRFIFSLVSINGYLKYEFLTEDYCRITWQGNSCLSLRLLISFWNVYIPREVHWYFFFVPMSTLAEREEAEEEERGAGSSISV